MIKIAHRNQLHKNCQNTEKISHRIRQELILVHPTESFRWLIWSMDTSRKTTGSTSLQSLIPPHLGSTTSEVVNTAR